MQRTRAHAQRPLATLARRSRPTRVLAILVAGWACAMGGMEAWGQVPGRHFPLNQNTQPGVAGEWAGIVGKADGFYFQPIRVELPADGQVTFFGAGQQMVETSAPGQIGLLVGHVYRIKISEMPDFPGAELYPSVELIDRLHPPRGRAADFPIPITFSVEEIELALQGRMVTKVVYLEQPQLANPIKLDATVPVEVLRPDLNPIAAADRLGRPMAIVRLGGRVPLMHGNQGFFGQQAPIDASAATPPPPAASTAQQPPQLFTE